MEINYRTKEESKKAQKEAFLKLTGAERILKFLELQEAMSLFPTKVKKDRSEHFVIHLKSKTYCKARSKVG